MRTRQPRPLVSGPDDRRGIAYNCSCRRRFVGGIWSDRCRLCVGKRMRRNLYRGDWGRCSTCRTVTRGMIDSRTCRRCQPLLNRPREVR